MKNSYRTGKGAERPSGFSGRVYVLNEECETECK